VVVGLPSVPTATGARAGLPSLSAAMADVALRLGLAVTDPGETEDGEVTLPADPARRADLLASLPESDASIDGGEGTGGDAFFRGLLGGAP
jgi:hypothetical protein